MSHAIVEAENLTFLYEVGKPVFKNVSFSLCQGEMLFLLGANGCGKTTMLNCLSGTYRLNGGRVLLSGTPTVELSPGEVARRVAYVPQIYRDNCSFLVKDYVVLGRAPHLSFMRMPAEEDYEAAWRVMEKMGITHLANKPYSRMSGGERQLTQIARALVQGSRLILLDEPTNHLDYGNQQRILKLLHALTGEGYAVILTTHMPDHPLMYNGKVGILCGEDGFLCGAANDLMTEEILKSIYDIDIDLFYIDRIGRKSCFGRNV